MSVLHKEDPEVTETSNGQLYRVGSSGCATNEHIAQGGPTTGLAGYSWRWKTGSSTPQFHKRLKEGRILPMTNWAQFAWTGTASPYQREYCDTSGRRYRLEGVVGLNADFDSDHPYRWLVRADVDTLSDFFLDPPDMQYFVQQAAARIAGGGWDILTFLAEIHDLRRMLHGISSKLVKLSDPIALARRFAKQANKGRKALELSRELANLWLEGRYGWRTLLYDISDFHNALVSKQDRRDRVKKSTGLTTSNNNTWSNLSTSNGITTKIANTVYCDVNYRATVVADIDVGRLQFNPVVTAWEVTRLSFVIDWLLNVGQALEAATFAAFATDYAAGYGYRADFNCSGTYSLDSTSSPVATVYSLHCDYQSSGYIESRTPTSVRITPRFKPRLDGFKILDLLALVRQRVS